MTAICAKFVVIFTFKVVANKDSLLLMIVSMLCKPGNLVGNTKCF